MPINRWSDDSCDVGPPFGTSASQTARRPPNQQQLDGAEAALRLRALKDNGDLDAYEAFYLTREHERLYPTSDRHYYDLTA